MSMFVGRVNELVGSCEEKGKGKEHRMSLLPIKV